ncbi:hypothetical protein EAG_06562 [Camponotus floridanus]|uniref:Uncharacterized protein n=1 Tax=Camponotus floridanus TaxID=104421 RepID=E2AMI6_CAMFO|nr:hypothetical protein EAG_06562 [Camponotus floridanus]
MNDMGGQGKEKVRRVEMDGGDRRDKGGPVGEKREERIRGDKNVEDGEKKGRMVEERERRSG